MVRIYLFFMLLLLSKRSTIYLVEDIDEIPEYAYFSIKYLVIQPILDSILEFILAHPLLPDSESLKHFDFYGNLCSSQTDILRECAECNDFNNYTETFKSFLDNLSFNEVEDCLTSNNDNWNDPRGIFRRPRQFNFKNYNFNESFQVEFEDSRFSLESQEESSSIWEIEYLRGFSRNQRWLDCPVSAQEMPKTFTSFPLIDVPLRRRFAMILETYLIDMVKKIYPASKSRTNLVKFDDLLGIILVYLYVTVRKEDALNLAYTWQIINDLKEMKTNLKLPKDFKSLDRFEGLLQLLDDILKYKLKFTFKLMIQTKILNFSSSILTRKVLNSSQKEIIKLFLKNSDDRNVKIFEIEPKYDGRLCHAVYIKSSHDLYDSHLWIFEELLKYKDVDWDALDCKGFTVLGKMVIEKGFDERFRLFLKLTEQFIICHQDSNILDECLKMRNSRQGKSRFTTYLMERSRSDDFACLLLTAALHDRMDYFDDILQFRMSNHCHELNSAFQQILQYTNLDEPYLYRYAFRIFEAIRDVYGMRGCGLEQLFLMKWEIQLARFVNDKIS